MDARIDRFQEKNRLIQMITSGHVSDMTIQEIQSILKSYQHDKTDSEKILQSLRNRLRPYRIRALEIQSFLDRGQGTEAQRKKWRDMLLKDQEKAAYLNRYLPQQEDRFAEIQRHIELLEATLAAKQRAVAPALPPVLDPVPVAPVPVAPVDPNPLTIHVQLMSGDIKTVVVDRRLPIHTFADLFAATHGYRQTDRLTFLLPSRSEEKYDDEADEAKEEIFWSHSHRRIGQTYQDLVGSDSTVHLFLLVQPLEDVDWPDKLALIRKILLADKLNLPTAEQIFDLYSAWILTHPAEYKNRYLRLKAFVQAHSDVFFPISEEKLDEVKQAMKIEAFREWYLTLQSKRTGPHGALHRPNVEAHIQRLLHRHALGARLQIGGGAIEFYLSTMTREEMFAMGLQLEHIQPGKIHSYLAEWDTWIARAFPSP